MASNDNVLYVAHLDCDCEDKGIFDAAFSALCGGIADFFKEYFSASYCVKYKPFSSIQEMKAGLFDHHYRVLSDVGQRVCLFVTDYYHDAHGGGFGCSFLPRMSEVQPEELGRTRFADGTPFPGWLEALFPQVPVVLLTRGDDARINHDDIPERWVYCPKGYIDSPFDFSRHMYNHFDLWWQPHFSNALDAYASASCKGGPKSGVAWHTPGHNAGSAFFQSPLLRAMHRSYGEKIFRTDLSVSVSHLGDLSEPDLDSPLKRTQAVSSDIFGSQDTFFITNGTSTSNKAMLMTLLKPGEKVLLDRNCHKSVHQAVVMSGAHPVYLKPQFNATLGVWTPIDLTILKERLTKNYGEPDKPRMLVLTTCTYEGILYPIFEIARWCRANGILFYCDEAWAPYLRFHPGYATQLETGDWCRYNAVDGGADFVVQSTHKALSAFSQASMIHITKGFKEKLNRQDPAWDWLRERFSDGNLSSYRRFRHDLIEVLRYWHSTSPHYPMLATLDCAGIQARVEGARILEERRRWVRDFCDAVNEFAGEPSVMTMADLVGADRVEDYAGYLQDPLKIVIGAKTPADAAVLKKNLEQEGIAWEKSTDVCVQFLVTPGTMKHHIQHLQNILRQNRKLLGKPRDDGNRTLDLAASDLVVLPRTAAACAGELVLLEEAVDRVCAQMLVPYPPGIPVLLPGIKITADVVAWVGKLANHNHHDVHGIYENGGKHFVKVMTKEDLESTAGFSC